MTLRQYYKIHEKEINDEILSAIREDSVNNDVTTKLLLSGKEGDKKLQAVLLCKQDCILAGIDIFKRVYRAIDKNVRFRTYKSDGERLKKGSKVLEVISTRRNLLVGERTALNFLQRMSGAATLTNEYVKKLKYKDSKILHTRKTTPNFRVFEIAAVKTGGGDFHRYSLSSYVMIKDNHIAARGGIQNVLSFLKENKIPNRLKQKFEIEVKNLIELNWVINYGKGIVKTVMLDNFPANKIETAIKKLKKQGFKTEISGGLNLLNFDKFQRKGIDYYSIGGLTHSYKSVDFSLEF
jgi:nicotinate-nucleotide pyrophosphorylase (carboxylating)